MSEMEHQWPEDALTPEEASEMERRQILDQLGETLAQTRSAAIDARENSGIEMEWLQDEEHYEGIDDANRGETAAWRGKPWGQIAPFDADELGSTIF